MFLLALLSLYVSAVHAIQTVSAPATVTAGVEFPVSITFDFDQGEYSIDKQWENYRLYLSVSGLDHYSLNWPLCYLSDVLPLSVSSTNVVVPKEAGPPDNTYHVYVFTFNGSFFEDGGQEAGLDYSDAIELRDTDVTAWSEQERAGPLREYDSIPCSAMQCNRDCKDRFYATKTAAFWTDTDYCECLGACPGVTTGHPNSLEGCSQAWGYIKTGTPYESTSVDTERVSTMTDDNESRATDGSSSTTTVPRGTEAMTTPAPAQATASTVNASPTTAGAPRALIIGNAYAALALVALLR